MVTFFPVPVNGFVVRRASGGYGLSGRVTARSPRRRWARNTTTPARISSTTAARATQRRERELLALLVVPVCGRDVATGCVVGGAAVVLVDEGAVDEVPVGVLVVVDRGTVVVGVAVVTVKVAMTPTLPPPQRTPML
jgi:hypothetical protein